MTMEYQYQKKNITRDLKDIQKTFEHVLAADLWQMDNEKLNSTVKGIMHLPVIVGIKIHSVDGKYLAVGGIIKQNSKVGNVGMNVNLLGLNDVQANVRQGEVYKYQVFEHHFPITYTRNDKTRKLAQATIYSNASVILRRIKLGFLLLAVSTVIKIIVLWLMFMLLFKVFLRNPLAALTDATRQVDLDDLEKAKVKIKGSEKDELGVLGKSFNSMIENLQTSLDQRKHSEQQREKLFLTVEAQNQQLEANQQELSLKNEELQSIVYISSHDLKTPLVNINGFSAMLIEHCDEMKELLKKCATDTDTKKEITSLLNDGIPTDLEYIATSTKRMQRLIEGLLQVSRIGTVEIKTKNINMNDLVSEIIDNVKYKTEDLDAEIALEYLPDCTGNKHQITQVFTNLIDNALKYLSPKRKGRIKITGKTKNKESIYCIEDNGIGINPAYHGKVFEIYHRLDPQTSTEGDGLGLTIVRRILDRHKGRIWLESELEKGSKFFVAIPAK
jgi:signal transduction histidine kinase